jgi:hypothetical protein
MPAKEERKSLVFSWPGIIAITLANALFAKIYNYLICVMNKIVPSAECPEPSKEF